MSRWSFNNGQWYDFYDFFKLSQAHATSLLEFQCFVSVFHWHEHVLKFSLYSKGVFLEKKRVFRRFCAKKATKFGKKKVFFLIYLEEWILSQFCFDCWNIAKYNNKSVRLSKRRIWWNLMQELSFDFQLW